MVFYAITGLINAITSTILGTFVLWKSPKNPVNVKYFLFNLMVAVWSYGYFFWQLSKSESEAIFWARILFLGAMCIPPLFLDFVVTWTDQYHRHRRYVYICYVVTIVFALLDLTTPLVVSAVEPRNIFSFWPVPGIVFHLVLAFFLWNACYACYLLIHAIKASRDLRRKQIVLVLIGMIIGYAGGSTNFFLWYNIPIPPIGNGLAPIYMGMMTYAILRYRAMEIEVIIKKTLVFAGIFSFFFGIFAFLSFLMTDVLGQVVTGPARFLIFTAVAAFLAIVINRLHSFLVQITDKHLFQKKFDYQKILKDASRGLSQIQSLKHLLGLVIHFMTRRARIKSAAVYLRDSEKEDFLLHYARGYDGERITRTIKAESALVYFFSETKEALDIDKIDFLYHEAGMKTKWSHALIEQVIQEMKDLGVRVCVPTFLGGALKYFLVLGEKKSGDYYTDPDLNLFYTLAQESAIAIENARLYDEAIKRNYELQQINEQLNSASLKLQLALHDTEEANKKLQNTQAQLIHEQKMATLGRLASSVGHEVNNPLTILQMHVNRIVLKLRKEPDLKLKEVEEFFPKMENNINRIKAVVNTLTGLLKRHEKGKVEPLSLKIILEETLPLVQFQTYLDNLSGTEISINIPSNLPLIVGDLERLQEVFLNIFINAFHAMSEQGRRVIQVSAELDPHDKRMALIRFRDNGSGMNEETLKRIFGFRFTTKQEGKGQGLGLYMCKHIIELHGGTITAESKMGQGSIFIVRLPIYQEKKGEAHHS